MRCRYIYTEEGEKVLIPECWPVVVSGDIRDCICRNISYKSFEREDYNQHVAELKREIENLQSDNAYLRKVIEKLLKK